MADWFGALSRLAVEVPVREPSDQCISRNESDQAQPDVEVEERYHGEREQQKRQFVPIHEVAHGPWPSSLPHLAAFGQNAERDDHARVSPQARKVEHQAGPFGSRVGASHESPFG